MFYSNAKILHPRVHNQAEFRVPDTAQLAGVVYDYDVHCIVTYDRVEGKLLWLTQNEGAVEFSAIAPLPNDNYVIDMCQFQNSLYCLVYLGDGKLGLYVGNLQEGRDTGIVQFDSYEIPYCVPESPMSASQIWAATHTSELTYLKFHPKFCRITHIGHNLYLMLGVSDDVVSEFPSTLGQYLVAFSLTGSFLRTYSLDDSPAYLQRPGVFTDSLNGTHVACTYHDGVVSVIAASPCSNTGILKFLKLGNEGEITDVEIHPFFVGPFPIGTSMCAAGRTLYYLVNNRIFSASIFMFDVWCNDEGELQSNIIDMGIILSEGWGMRKATLQNSSPFYTYHNLIVESRTPNLQVAHLGETPVFADRIKFTQPMAPGDRVSFMLRVVVPLINEAKTPAYFYDSLAIKAEGEW